jgi:hypothetical protein
MAGRAKRAFDKTLSRVDELLNPPDPIKIEQHQDVE